MTVQQANGQKGTLNINNTLSCARASMLKAMVIGNLRSARTPPRFLND